MKKIICSIALILAMVLLLVSCKLIEILIPPKDAAALYERIDERMDDLDSYKVDMIGHAKFWISGYEFVSDLSGTMVVGDDNYYYEYSETSSKCHELDIDEKIYSSKIYSDGKAYIYNESNGIAQRLVSSMTAEEFEEYHFDNSLEDVDFCEASSADYHKDGKSWVLEYSGYSNEIIDKVNDALDTESLVGTKIKDMKVKIVSNWRFYVTEVTAEFVFETEEGGKTPEFYITYNISDHDDASNVDFDKTKYTEVDDLMILKELRREMEDAKESNDGSLYFSVTTSISLQGEIARYKESETIKYGLQDGKFFYDAVVVADGNEMSINYKDGVLRVTSYGMTETASQTDDEARETIAEVIEQIMYDFERVTDVEKQAEGSYKITLHCDEGHYEEMLVGYDIYSAEQVITVRYIEAEKRAESKISLTGSQGFSLTLNVVIIFDYQG